MNASFMSMDENPDVTEWSTFRVNEGTPEMSMNETTMSMNETRISLNEVQGASKICAQKSKA